MMHPPDASMSRQRDSGRASMLTQGTRRRMHRAAENPIHLRWLRSLALSSLFLLPVMIATTWAGASAGAATPTDTPETDPDTGLVMLPGWQSVASQCTGCHSAALVRQNRGTRAHWLSIIRWMQATQGLWEFPSELESELLDYLSVAYGASEPIRRANLAPDLLPPAGNTTNGD